jgi:hypothetical protein
MSQHPEIPGRPNPEFPRHYGEEPVFQNYRVVIEIAGKKESAIFEGLGEAGSRHRSGVISTDCGAKANC